MSLYGEKFKIGGLSCGLVLRGSANGEYRVVFEREYAIPGADRGPGVGPARP